MDELHLAAEMASIGFAFHWRRGFIERSHGLIARTQSERMRREHIAQQELDIDDVVRELAIINI